MSSSRQISFSRGELSPALQARVDLAQYATGLKTCRNFTIQRHGGVANRPGTQFIAEVKDSTKKVRLIPFVFNASQTYVLEFGDLYKRVYQDGVQLQSGGSPYEITTPYLEADLPELQYVQSADVITITNSGYAPRDLSRTGHTAWTLTTITFGATITAPTGLASDSAGTAYYYKVTAVDATTSEESLPSAEAGSTSQISTLSWTAVTGAGLYNIYKKINGQYGWIGVAGAEGSPTFKDDTYIPDALDSPPVDRQPFTGAGNYPSTATYYQQRRIFANTDNNPEGVWTSKSALRKNLMISTPLQDDDAVTFSLVGRQVNEVKHMLEADKLIAFTASGEYAIEGDAAGILTPSGINPKQYTGNGSGFLAPLLVGGGALYIQARGSVVRDLAYEFEAAGYRGNELSIFSSHLIDGHTIVDWAYQQIPHSIIWMVRDDGVLLGLTYVREHQVIGWHRHDFNGVEAGVSYFADGTYTADGSISASGGTDDAANGLVENVCVVPEGNEDVLYLVVKRLIDGSWRRYVERMHTRQITDIKDAVFMDCSLTYDGRNTTTSHTMRLTGGSTWAYDEDLTLESSTAYFAASDVGNEIIMKDEDEGVVLRCTITAYTSTTDVTVRANKTVPLVLQNVSTYSWEKAVDEVSGLEHLEGRAVSILVDGFVSANPHNPEYGVRVVTNGAITLSDPHAVIHVGLPYISEIETLNIDSPQTILTDKKKHISGLTLHVEATRGIWAGPDEDNLTELKTRDDEGYDDPIDLKTGPVEMNITAGWSESGSVLIRQTDPLPVSILAIVPNGFIARG